MARCEGRKAPAVFVERMDSDGLLSESFCVVGEVVRCYADTFREKWNRSTETSACDGRCGRVHDLAKVVESARTEAKRDRIRIVRCVGTVRAFLRGAEARSARHFLRWYYKRSSKGEAFCTGRSHFRIIWNCDTGVTAYYTRLSFEVTPCDGTCRPDCTLVPVSA